MRNSRTEKRHDMAPLVVVALPFAFREGLDEYNGIMRYLHETGTEWDLRIVRHSFDAKLFRNFPMEKVSGVICGMDFRPGIAGYEPYFPEDVLGLLSKHGIPMVGLDLPDDLCIRGKGARRAFLSVDPELIGRTAARHLAAIGEYAAFGFVGAFAESVWSRDRGAFFIRELRRLGRHDASIFLGDIRRDREKLHAWLKAMPKPAAVFASNDHCADIVLRECLRGGVRVPDEMAVLGVDDDPIFCIHNNPSLSSLHPDFEAEGHLAAQTMAEFLAGRRPRSRIVVKGAVTIMARMSTAPSSPAGRLVRRADEIIAARACTGLNADILASALGISRRLLDLRYRQINGKSVRESLEDTRLGRVKQLLSGTRLSHHEIAGSCGFGSESYLEHVFFKRFGQSMSEFRRSVARAEGEKP